MKKLALWGWVPLTWFFVFLLIPIILILVTSFMTRGTYGGIEWEFQWGNYLKLFRLDYLKILFSSISLSFLTAVFCFIFAFPIAWYLSTSRNRDLYITLLAIPFLTNLIIRVYGIKLFVGAEGPLQVLMTGLGISFDPFQFSQNQLLVMYGMITTYMPFMIFPIYVALEKYDFTLIEAAKDLGANQTQIFFKILVPSLKLPIFNGFMLVFVPCLGEFVIPDLLGGAKNMLIGNLITEHYLKSRDWPMGSALSIVLMILLFLIPYSSKKFFLRGTHGKG